MRKTVKGGLLMAATVGGIILGAGGSALADASAVPTVDSGADATEGWVTIESDGGTMSAAASKNVGGGSWNYGSNRAQGYGWSDYYHARNCHGSSAKSGRYYVKDHGVAAKRWSRTTVTRDGKVKAYWTNKC